MVGMRRDYKAARVNLMGAYLLAFSSYLLGSPLNVSMRVSRYQKSSIVRWAVQYSRYSRVILVAVGVRA